MEALLWLLIVALSSAAGYFGYGLTGDWPSGAVALVMVAVVLTALRNGHWMVGAMAFFAGTYGLFTLLGEAPAAAATKPRGNLGVVTEKGQRGLDQDADAAASGAKAPVDDASKDTRPDGKAEVEGATLRDCPDCPDLVVVPGGAFYMGTAPGNGPGGRPADPREGPLHRVTVPAFAAAQTAVTRKAFAAFVRATNYRTTAEREGGCFTWSGSWKLEANTSWRQPGLAQTDEHPVVCVSWHDARTYTEWLGSISGKKYRLLSEAEREYAARAGSPFEFWWGSSLSPDKANYDLSQPGFEAPGETWRRSTVDARHFTPNPFGLYNVHGNVWEWVEDCRHDTYQGAPADAAAWVQGCANEQRALRGGAWIGDPLGLRSAARIWFAPDFRLQAAGFRVARDVGANGR